MNILQTDLKHWIPNLDILSIRVTKPRIPEKIKKNFEEMESQRAMLTVTKNKKTVAI